MNVLVIGNGCREEVICQSLKKSSLVRHIFRCSSEFIDSALSNNLDVISELERKENIFLPHLTIVGSESSLELGIVDVFRKKGLKIFGPTKEAAQIETSKSFAKTIMNQEGIPTARWKYCSNVDEAIRDVKDDPSLCVIKADGLSGGKGVIVTSSGIAAIEAIKELSSISKSFVIEEKLEGKESSWMILTDGINIMMMDPVRDYKRLNEDDEGPNTGGMGAYCPVPEEMNLKEKIKALVFEPALRGLRKRGILFQGCLYAGLMIKGEDIRVLEFNARFGDPETQALFPRIDEDIIVWINAIASGDLVNNLPIKLKMKNIMTVYVTVAHINYPYPTTEYDGYESIINIIKFSAVLSENVIFSPKKNITRMFGVLGKSKQGKPFRPYMLTEARIKAYKLLERILKILPDYHNMMIRYREDIGKHDGLEYL